MVYTGRFFFMWEKRMNVKTNRIYVIIIVIIIIIIFKLFSTSQPLFYKLRNYPLPIISNNIICILRLGNLKLNVISNLLSGTQLIDCITMV